MIGLPIKLGVKLRELREAANLSQSKVSDLIMKNRGTYRALENDRAVLDVVVLDKLCQLYNVTPNELMGYKDRA